MSAGLTFILLHEKLIKIRAELLRKTVLNVI